MPETRRYGGISRDRSVCSCGVEAGRAALVGMGQRIMHSKVIELDSRDVEVIELSVIPRSPPTMDNALSRGVPGHWLILVSAIVASGLGVLCAKMWPYYAKPTGEAVAVALPDTKAEMPPDQPDSVITGDSCGVPLPSPRIALNLRPVVVTGTDAAPLRLSIDGDTAGMQVTVCGLPPKSVVTTGQAVNPTTWALAVPELAEAALVPPPGFAGEIQVGFVLVRADRSIADRQTLRFMWQPSHAPTPATVSLAPSARTSTDPETERQIDEARHAQTSGDVAQARKLLRRFAQTDARAAFMLADSYDPIVLAKPRLLPSEADPEAARLWYKKAADLGAVDANARLERLEQWNW
jgi:hypothetical protein